MIYGHLCIGSPRLDINGTIVAEYRIMVAASTVEKERSRRLGTSILNQVVQEALAFKSPPRTRGGKRGRVYYCTQVRLYAISCFYCGTHMPIMSILLHFVHDALP